MKAWHFSTTIFLALVSVNTAARAAETLRFNENLPHSSFEKIKSYSSNSLDKNIQDFEIGKADLNNDGLDEFIARPKNCQKTPTCEFYVLAETPGAIVSLGRFEGQHVALGSEYRHGVRNLLVFYNGANDFDYHLYTWHPEISAYRKSGS